MTENIKKLAKEHGVVCLLGEISPETVNTLIEDLIETSLKVQDKQVYLAIDSVGGNLAPALKAFDLIKGLKLNIEACVIGNCFSAAGIILQACQRRLSSPHSTFLPHAHTMTTTLRFDGTLKERIDHEINSAQELGEAIFAIYRRKLTLPENQIGDMLSLPWDKVLNAKQALSIGLIDEIVETFPFVLV